MLPRKAQKATSPTNQFKLISKLKNSKQHTCTDHPDSAWFIFQFWIRIYFSLLQIHSYL